MNSHIEKWIEESSKKFLHDIGIGKSQKVLDSGCGSGDYTGDKELFPQSIYSSFLPVHTA